MGLDIFGIEKIKESNTEDYVFDTQYNESYIFQLGELKPNTKYLGWRINIDSVSFSYGGYSSFRESIYSLFNDNDRIQDLWSNKKLGDLLYTQYKNFERKHKLNNLIETDIKIKETPPFFEMLFFSDCEGIIGPKICKNY